MGKKSRKSEPDEAKKKVKVLHLRVTDDEYGQIAADADGARLSMSEYMRRRALGHPVMANTDASVLRELRRQGMLIKHCLIESDGIAAQEGAAAYRGIVALIEKIAARMGGAK